MRICICGSRGFNDYVYPASKMIGKSDIIILSGGARGADKLGERYAHEQSLPLEIFPADWNTHGRSAGVIRNMEMADKADLVMAFWDGKSPGTGHMIRYCEKKNIPAEIYKC